MEQLHYACKKLTDKNEIAMIQKYGWDAKRYTTALTGKQAYKNFKYPQSYLIELSLRICACTYCSYFIEKLVSIIQTKIIYVICIHNVN